MNHSIVILCSLSLCLWGYQTGVWQLAIPMVLALEARNFIRHRWTLSWKNFQLIHVLGAFLWLLSIFYIPSISPSPIPYSASLHILKCLPVGLFPLILAQTYCVNFILLYRNQVFVRQGYGSQKNINLYYPYFAICLLAASATGGNTTLFLILLAGLVAGFLGTLRSQRFSLEAFYGLIGLAVIISIVSTHQLNWLQANIKLRSPDLFSNFMQNIASFSSENSKPRHKDIVQIDSFQSAVQQAERIETQGLPSSTPPDLEMASTQEPQSSQGISQSTSSTASRQETRSSPSVAQPTQRSTLSQSIAQSAEASASLQGNTPSQGNTPLQGSGPSSNATPVNRNPNAVAVQPPSQQSRNSVSHTAVVPSQGVASSAQDAGSTNDSSSSQTTHQINGDTNRNPIAQSLQTVNSNGVNQTQSSFNIIQQAGDNVDPQNSLTQIGNRGALQLSDEILFRVAPNLDSRSNRQRPTFPLYIREATYNQYHSGTWKAVQPQFVSQSSYSNRQHWVLGSQTPNTTSVRISTHFLQPESILKLPIGTSEIDHLAVETMQINQYGTVAVKGQPGGKTYTVQFDPTRSLDSLPTQLDIAIPQIEQPTMQKILKLLDLKGKSGQETVNIISAFFSQNFSYSLNLLQPQEKITPLSAFLLDHRSGHCEFFASATSLLLRAAGIPTRYAVGYTVREYSPSEQQYIVRARNAHAWVMAYVDGSWIRVDTTPGIRQPGTVDVMLERRVSQSERVTPPSEHGQRQSGTIDLGSDRKPILENRADPTPKQGFSQNGSINKQNDSKHNHKSIPSFQEKASDVGSFLFKMIQSFSEKFSKIRLLILSQYPKYSDSLLWAGTIIVLGLAIIIFSVFFAWRMMTCSPKSTKRLKNLSVKLSQKSLAEGLDSEFYILEKRLEELGLERQSSETVRQWILRLKQNLPESRMHNLNQIIDLHYRYRFDPQGIAADDRAKLKSMIQSWLIETTI